MWISKDTQKPVLCAFTTAIGSTVSPSFKRAYHGAHGCRITMEAPWRPGSVRFWEYRNCWPQRSFGALEISVCPLPKKIGRKPAWEDRNPFSTVFAAHFTQPVEQGINYLYMLLCALQMIFKYNLPSNNYGIYATGNNKSCTWVSEHIFLTSFLQHLNDDIEKSQ